MTHDAPTALDADLKAELATRTEPRAPWERHPEAPPGSIFWRMGLGETYLMVWSEWWERAALSVDDGLAYFRAHLPPDAWLDWAGMALWPELADGDDDDEAARRLATHGIGSYEAWLAACDGA